MTKQELNKFLNFMLSIGAINHNEYTELYMKVLPYVK